MFRTKKGQNIIEFIIILALIAVAGIAVFSLLGNNIQEMFSKSKMKTEAYKPFEFGPPVSQNVSSPISNPSDPVNKLEQGTYNINGLDVTVADDGTTSFNVAGQDVVLSANIMSKVETVMESTGSAGTEMIVAMVQKMIEDHKDEYSGDVPMEMMFGKGVRTETDSYAYGSADINLVTLKVGDDFIIFQKDQEHMIPGQGGMTPGDYYIQGKVGDSKGIISLDRPDNKYTIPDYPYGLEHMNTTTDKNGNFYIVGDNNAPDGQMKDALTKSGVQVPGEFSDIVDQGELKQGVWLFEFQGSSKVNL
jgi:Flp pilus assembly pilin Flp